MIYAIPAIIMITLPSIIYLIVRLKRRSAVVQPVEADGDEELDVASVAAMM